MHNFKYVIKGLPSYKLCRECTINPNKKTAYCLRCEVRHNLNNISFCRYCKSCLNNLSLNHIYKHCDRCNECFLLRDEHNNLFECDNCIDSDSIDGKSESDLEETDTFLEAMGYELLSSDDRNFNQTDYQELIEVPESDIYDSGSSLYNGDTEYSDDDTNIIKLELNNIFY
jgi:hypothetical protein